MQSVRMASAADILAEVDAAILNLIAAINDGGQTQEYTVQGKTWKRVDFPLALAQLRLFRKDLQAEANTRNRGLRPVTVRRSGGVC